MTEEQWLACADPEPMFAFLWGRPGLDRKLRLFACACCRRIWRLLPSERCRQAVFTCERYLDGAERRKRLKAARTGLRRHGEEAYVGVAAQAVGAVWWAVLERHSGSSVAWHVWRCAAKAAEDERAERRAQCHLLRDILGNPFHILPSPAASWLAWNDGAVAHLARAIYNERSLPEGTLDGGWLAVLADALAEAGCIDADLLAHLCSSGPHVRGCYVLDALLGKQ